MTAITDKIGPSQHGSLARQAGPRMSTWRARAVRAAAPRPRGCTFGAMTGRGRVHRSAAY